MTKAGSRINEQGERRRILKNLGASIRARPFLCIALMLFWTWLNLAFQGPLFFPPVRLEPDFQLLTWFAPILFAGIAYFALGVLFRKTSKVVKQRWYIPFVAALMTSGAIICFVWINVFGASLGSVPDIAFFLFGSALIGVGTALLMVEWGRVFGYLGPQEVLYQGIIAMLGSALLVSALSLMPPFVGRLIFVLIPFPLAWCLYHTLRRLPQKTLFNHGFDTDLKTPYKFLVTAFLHGLSLGVAMGGIVFLGNQSDTSFLTALSFVVAALLLLLTAVFVKMDFNHLIYQIGFGITATGAFLIAILGDMPLLGTFFQLIGFCYVHLVVWGLCSYLIKNFRLPAAWVISWSTCFLMLGQLFGGVTSNVSVQFGSVDTSIHMMAVAMVFILLIAGLFMLSNRNLTTGWGAASPAIYSGPSDSGIGSVVEKLTVENNLTPRESEILALLSRGRNRKVISEELVISIETTKTHINGLYRKLGVHSQQEVLDLIEDLRVEMQAEEQSTAFR